MDTQGRSRERGQSIGFLVPNCPNLVKRAQFLKTQMALMASVCSFSNLVMHHLTLENQIKIPAFMWKGSHKPHLPLRRFCWSSTRPVFLFYCYRPVWKEAGIYFIYSYNKSASLLIYFMSFIYLQSMTEGPEGHWHCRRYTKIYRYTACGSIQKEKKQTNKNEIIQQHHHHKLY